MTNAFRTSASKLTAVQQHWKLSIVVPEQALCPPEYSNIYSLFASLFLLLPEILLTKINHLYS